MTCLFESRIILGVLCVLFQISCQVWSLPKPCPRFDVLYGRTRSRSRGRAMRITCDRGYNLIGERTLLCNKGKWDSDIPICAKTGCALPESRIPGGKILASYRHQILRTVCEDGFDLQGSHIIFCNGIVWNDTLPICVGKPAAKVCDFENSKNFFCGWHQTKNMLLWQMGRDRLENWVSDWAPDFDHTFGVGSFGHYIHMKGPTDGMPFLTAGQLKSPFYRKPDTPQVCFVFWYHVFGEKAGDLKVLVNRQVIWSREQINIGLWQRGALQFVANSTYQIVIEASVPNNLVTVALDDLEVIENCSKLPDYAVLDPATSCEGRCGDEGTVDDCSCSFDCQDVDNCCPDWSYFCPSIASNVSDTTIVTSPPVTTITSPADTVTVTYPYMESTHKQDADKTFTQDQRGESTGIKNQNNQKIGNNQEDNNIDKIVENTFDNNVNEHNNMFENKFDLSADVNREIDVPLDNDTTIRNPVPHNVEGAPFIKNISDITTRNTQQRFTVNELDKVTLNTQNQTQDITMQEIEPDEIEVMTNNKTTENSTPSNGGTIVENGISLHPNPSTNKKRMRESVKKSTVVYEDEEGQLKPTKNKTDVTEEREITACDLETITDSSQIGEKMPSRVENQSTSKQGIETTNNNENITSVSTISGQSINNQATTSLLNDSEKNKESLDIMDIIKTKDANIEFKKSTAHQEFETHIENENLGENSSKYNLSTTKSLNTETLANNNSLNKNYTKIILYKNSISENSTANSSNNVNMNDISRVQIHNQANGVPYIENVKINNVGKYNESTIARLKIISDHINNVIAKKNNTHSSNATSSGSENNNATVLHKLKHFITSIIDSHNKSTQLINSTEISADRSISSNYLNAESQGQVKNTFNVSNNSNTTTGAVNPDGLVILSDTVMPKATTVIPYEEIINISKGPTKVRIDTIDESNQTNSFSQSTRGITKESILDLQSRRNITSFDVDINRNSEDLNLLRAYHKEMPGAELKSASKTGNENSADNILNDNLNKFKRDKNFYSGSSRSSNESTSTKEPETFRMSTTPSTTITTNKYFRNSPFSRYMPKFKVTKPIRFRSSTSYWKSKTTVESKLGKFNSSIAWQAPRPVTSKPVIKTVNFTFPVKTSRIYSPFNWLRRTTTTSSTVEPTLTTQTRENNSTSSVELFSISLLKNMTNASEGVSRRKEQGYKYQVWEETTGSGRNEHIVIQSASKNENHEKAPRSTSLVGILSLALVASAVLVFSVTSYCLVQKYRTTRADDTEIAFLTGDELLYFHTPRPQHRSAHRNPSLDDQENGSL